MFLLVYNLLTQLICLTECSHGSIRLRGGSSNTNGRVEVCLNGDAMCSLQLADLDNIEILDSDICLPEMNCSPEDLQIQSFPPILMLLMSTCINTTASILQMQVATSGNSNH